MRDAEIDEPCFLVTADDVDREAERRLRLRQEAVRVRRRAKSLRRHGAHRRRMQSAQPFGVGA